MLGISRQRVNELGRVGKIQREADGRWNADKVREALHQNLDHRQSIVTRGGNKSGGDTKPPTVKKVLEGVSGVQELQPGTIAYETYRLTKEKADRAALDRQEAEGTLVRAEEIEKYWTEAAIKIRDAVMGLTSRVCNRLPDEWRREVTSVLDDEARHVLTALSDELRNWKAG